MSIERKLRRKNAARKGTEMSGEIRQNAVGLGENASKQIRGLVDVIQHNNDQLNAFLAGARAALDVPDDWKFDVGMMAFVSPSAPPAEQSDAEQGEA